jgi:NAD(P)-dependent dehydrogenase (short-subunit alcohol dehydrogenase family)
VAAHPSSSRVALVTGSNRGIGLEVCRQLLRAGHRVALTGRDVDRVRTVLGTLGVDESQAIAVALDVRDPSTIASAQRTIDARLGPVDMVINNAAILIGESTDVLDIPLDDYRETLETNLLGAIAVCQALVPAMAERRYGRVVNVSSGAGQLAGMSSYAPAYSMSKAALNAFTKILAATYRNSGVLVNAVDPGWVRTDMGGRHAPRSVEQGADTIVWLATLDSRGPTGGFFRDRHPIEW